MTPPVRRIRVRVELKGLGHPMAPPSPVEVSFLEAHENGVLELVPRGALFTEHIGDSGKREAVPDAWLTRYCFRVRTEHQAVLLDPAPDKYGHRQPYAVKEPANGQIWNGQGPIRLEIGKPVAIFLNVPGGGPQWTLALQRIE